MKHRKLTEEQWVGLADILLRRLSNKFDINATFFSDEQWISLVNNTLSRVVYRGKWQLKDAFWFADTVVDRIIRRRLRK